MKGFSTVNTSRKMSRKGSYADKVLEFRAKMEMLDAENASIEETENRK